MIKLSKLSKKHRFLLITYFQFLVLGILILAFHSNLEIGLFINKLNNPLLDYFFKYWTLFGTFTLIGPIILILCFQKYRYALITAVSSLMGFFLVQFAKRFIWYDAPRPKVFFENMPDIHYVAGVHLHSAHSFPSGHTTGAFALFMALALITKRPIYQMLFLITAILVGYSRMYLSQHFLVDVVVGSAIGTFSAAFSYYWFINSPKKGLDKSLRTLFKRTRESQA
ncbi:MAG: phosphatase PAP2 family protein [Bacteroidia bacterium]|nr:phosphatase PAP2 family protein [Bacteroidia bacterium]